MIRREIGDDGICVLTFDRPGSGANIFDAADHATTCASISMRSKKIRRSKA